MTPRRDRGSELPTVFVSHHRKDMTWAAWAVDQLAAAGYPVEASRDYLTGDNVTESIRRAIESADRVVCLLSPDYVASEYTWAEFRAGPSKRIAFRVQNCDPEDLLQGVPYVELVGLDKTAAAERFLLGIRGFPPLPAKTLSPGVSQAEEPTYDVFLSYNRAEEGAVEAIAHRLRSEGLRPFLDRWDLVPGRPWPEELERAHQASRCYAVFVGSSGLSRWARREVWAALDRDDLPVIPVLLPGAQEEDEEHLPPFLRSHTWIDLRQGTSDPEGFRRLVSGIRGEPPGFGGSPGSSTRPSQPDPRALELSEALEAAYLEREQTLETEGDTSIVDERILELRREIRAGPLPEAGDFLQDGRYKLLEQIGSGGFATVWKALDRRPPSASRGPEDPPRAVREGPDSAGTVLPWCAPHGPAAASRDHPGVRSGGPRRSLPFLRDGAGPGRRLAGHGARRAALCRGAARGGPLGRGRSGLRTRGRSDPSGCEAGEHPAGRSGQTEADGFRLGEGRGFDGRDADGRDAGHVRLCGPGGSRVRQECWGPRGSLRLGDDGCLRPSRIGSVFGRDVSDGSVRFRAGGLCPSSGSSGGGSCQGSRGAASGFGGVLLHGLTGEPGSCRPGARPGSPAARARATFVRIPRRCHGSPSCRSCRLSAGRRATRPDEFGFYAELRVGEVVQRMRWIEPGTFQMGSPEGEAGRSEWEGPQHEVKLTEGFWLAEAPCTQELWVAVMGENPSGVPVSSAAGGARELGGGEAVSGAPRNGGGRRWSSSSDGGGMGVCVPC